jgi:hypothetical protein
VVPFEDEQITASAVLFRNSHWRLPRANAEPAMCEKCLEIDARIERYQRLSSGITDQATLDGIKQLIEQAAAQKTALHPEQEK